MEASVRNQHVQLQLRLQPESTDALEPEVKKEVVGLLAKLLLAVAQASEDAMGGGNNEHED